MTERRVGIHNSHGTRRPEDFATRGEEPVTDEVQLHAWMNSTLRELSELIKQARAYMTGRRPHDELGLLLLLSQPPSHAAGVPCCAREAEPAFVRHRLPRSGHKRT